MDGQAAGPSVLHRLFIDSFHVSKKNNDLVFLDYVLCPDIISSDYANKCNDLPISDLDIPVSDLPIPYPTIIHPAEL